MKKLLAGCLIVASNLAWGDVIGFHASGGMFNYQVSGTIRDSSAVQVDLKNDLALSDRKEASGYVYIEHPVPLIPNIRLGTTSLKMSGAGSLTATYNGVSFSAAVNSELDLSHTEVAVYYQIIDSFMDFDLGLNFKLFNGRATITDASTPGNTSTQKLEATVPMLYGAINIPLYGSGFSIGADLSVISYDNNSMSDLLMRVRYQTSYHLGVEAGVRNLSLKYENTTDATYADLKINGPYLNLFLYF
jgi:outer membrane protein